MKKLDEISRLLSSMDGGVREGPHPRAVLHGDAVAGEHQATDRPAAVSIEQPAA